MVPSQELRRPLEGTLDERGGRREAVIAVDHALQNEMTNLSQRGEEMEERKKGWGGGSQATHID